MKGSKVEDGVQMVGSRARGVPVEEMEGEMEGKSPVVVGESPATFVCSGGLRPLVELCVEPAGPQVQPGSLGEF